MGTVQELIDEASRRYLECTGEVLRFQIVKGVLWVDHLSERHDGWYPSKFGPGASLLDSCICMPAKAARKFPTFGD